MLTAIAIYCLGLAGLAWLADTLFGTPVAEEDQ